MSRPVIPRASIACATERVEQWFRSLDRAPFAFQRQAWRAYLANRHGLIHAHTGTGKTLAAFLGPVIEQLALDHANASTRTSTRTGAHDCTRTGAQDSRSPDASITPLKRTGALKTPNASIDATARTGIDCLPEQDTPPKLRRLRKPRQLRILWITPLRALAGDTETNLRAALQGVGLDWAVETRTSDTSASLRAKQRASLPEVLVTTPESATVLLSREDCFERFAQLNLIVVDEWHELLGGKRGVQTELALARFRTIQPGVRIWGLSATLGNLSQALWTLVGCSQAGQTKLIEGKLSKKIDIQELIPDDMERFPWAGHLGHRLASQVAEQVRAARSTLVFANTRSQAELWYRALLAKLPELAGQMAVHHGSLDQGLRIWIENRLRQGQMRCCVCTSSLELGVDFPVVDRVIQVGSPKGVARLIQRAGRSGHKPGQTSQITFVPTHALELVEIAALKQAIGKGHIEKRIPLDKPLDVLAQHVVTVALGGGFRPDDLLDEVRGTNAYQRLADHEWQWVLDFATRGGSSLAAYPDYHRIAMVDGRYSVSSKRLAALHRMSIGTIVSDASVLVRYSSGKSLGTVEDTFIARLSAGDKFMLAGKLLELVRVHDNTAWVKRGRGKETAVPRWLGGRMPLSTELSRALREQLEQCLAGRYTGQAMKAVRPMLELQQNWSTLPAEDQLLVECWEDRDGHYLFVYPFEGRLVHEGLAALWALRLSRIKPSTFSMAMNDYGFLLVSKAEIPVHGSLPALLATDGVADDILGSLNASEMCRRQFREIARVAGLLFQGYPGAPKLAKHLQASSNLFYEVFTQYDPENLLLKQAKREVLERQLESARLQTAMLRMARSQVLIQNLSRPSPLAFPLIADRLRDRLSSESFSQRIERIVKTLSSEAKSTQ